MHAPVVLQYAPTVTFSPRSMFFRVNFTSIPNNYNSWYSVVQTHVDFVYILDCFWPIIQSNESISSSTELQNC